MSRWDLLAVQHTTLLAQTQAQLCFLKPKQLAITESKSNETLENGYHTPILLLVLH